MPSVRAADTSVTTYADQSLESATATASKPLKAGELTLPKSQKGQVSSPPRLAAPSLPVGSVAAPQIQSSGPRAGSSTNYQLMLGLKLSLQKDGLSPEASSGKTALPQASVDATGAPQSLLAPASVPVAAPSISHRNTGYQPGQEPRNLATFLSGGTEPQTEAEAEAETTPDSSTPKATSIEQQPEPLTKAAQAEAASKPAKTSVFGAPVAAASPSIPVADSKTSVLSAPAPVAEPVQEKVATAYAASCEEKVTPWTKTCEDAGYPAGYFGQLTGETRVVCPSAD
jgi:hypothetical protein